MGVIGSFVMEHFGTLAWVVPALLTVAWYIYLWTRHARLPPGPLPYPVVGNLFTLRASEKSSHFKLLEMGKKYKGIFTLFIGDQPTVWLTSFKHFREAFVQRGWDCAGRPPEMMIPGLSRENYPTLAFAGITPVDKEVHKFVLTSLKSTGFVDQKMQERVIEEVGFLVEAFQRHDGEAFDPRSYLANATANSIASILFGRRFDYDDEEFQTVIRSYSRSIDLFMDSKMDEAFPILKWIPRKSRKECMDGFYLVTEFMRQKVRENAETWVKGMARNFMDVWMDRQSEVRSALEGEAFAMERLPIAMLALFIAGYETSTLTLTWLLAILLRKPDVQYRMQMEIDEMVGRNTPITLDYRDDLPYTEAVVLETMRMFPGGPIGIPHYTEVDTTIAGYAIPKGTRLVAHLFSIHYDPSLWEAPHKFRPERFIVDGQLRVPEAFVAFSAGKRACIGERVARANLFLTVANLMQRVSVHPPADDDLPSLDIQSNGFAITMSQRPFQMEVEVRCDTLDGRFLHRRSTVWPSEYIPPRRQSSMTSTGTGAGVMVNGGKGKRMSDLAGGKAARVSFQEEEEHIPGAPQ
ncbi:cytochrome P450 2F2-like [Paramacrobiotus metropolitanus]|uniref:cytochrome P450 2F2-like n=1 Tax=Paramacrobiotus metropolitanus TaxID=2943436 RepID=UPI002445E17C|nr:cytochrome P450 2F2-like [Paramacrobiotus metropolitanus]